MSRSVLPTAGLIACAVLSGCGVTPAGAEAPAATRSSPSASPSASESAGPLSACVDVASEGVAIEIAIETVSFAFDTQRIDGPRHCQPFEISFTNNDADAEMAGVITTTEHDIDIRAGNLLGPVVFNGELIADGTIRYEVPGLPAGEYYFYCSTHPEPMHGTLTVGR